MQENAVEAKSRCRGGGLPCVIRLDGANGDERGRTSFERVRNDEFELSCLVAAPDEPAQIVALDPDLGSAQFATEAA
jgi:hypothetical protein